MFLRTSEIDDVLSDTVTGEPSNKTVYITFFQGDQLKAKVKKICEGLEPPCEPAEDGSGEPALLMSSASIVIAAPNNTCPLSLEVSWMIVHQDNPIHHPTISLQSFSLEMERSHLLSHQRQSRCLWHLIPVLAHVWSNNGITANGHADEWGPSHVDMCWYHLFERYSCSSFNRSTYTVERLDDPKNRMKDRVTKMEVLPQISELDVLVAIFPHEEVINLTHYYQMLGFDGCVKLSVELGTYVDWSASVAEGAFVEELAAAEMSGTCPQASPPRTDWQRIAEQEGMNVSTEQQTKCCLPKKLQQFDDVKIIDDAANFDSKSIINREEDEDDENYHDPLESTSEKKTKSQSEVSDIEPLPASSSTFGIDESTMEAANEAAHALEGQGEEKKQNLLQQTKSWKILTCIDLDHLAVHISSK